MHVRHFFLAWTRGHYWLAIASQTLFSWHGLEEILTKHLRLSTTFLAWTRWNLISNYKSNYYVITWQIMANWPVARFDYKDQWKNICSCALFIQFKNRLQLSLNILVRNKGYPEQIYTEFLVHKLVFDIRCGYKMIYLITTFGLWKFKT